MANSSTLTRVDFAEDPLSYDSLRREGVGYVQQFSGGIWTDYNIHDPGITILESACFALTDIIYRCDFDVADYLSDGMGKLDFSRLGLQLPQAILPARPCTIADYHHAILDAVDEIEQLWLSQKAPACGLYQMAIRLTPSAESRVQNDEKYRTKLVNKVYQIYARMRNLGEDIEQIEIIPATGYQIKCQVEIALEADPVEVLAAIYYTSLQFLTGQLTVLGFEELKNAGLRLDEILGGPDTRHGRYEAKEAPSRDQSKHLESLYTRLMAIEGIGRIDELQLKGQSGQIVDNRYPIIDTLARLEIPQQQSDILIDLKRGDYPFIVPFEVLKTRLSQREFKQQSMRHSRQDLAMLYPMPQGEYIDFDYFHSIATHLPPNYRMNESGYSDRLSEADKASSHQLQGYLLLFDQFMANFGANIQGLNQLFSLDCESKESYHFKLLSGHKIDSIYVKDIESKIEQILRRFDHFYDRKGRVFDYLLALYGESYDGRILEDFNYYDSDEQLAHRLLTNKRRFLTQVATLGKDRGGAFNLAKIQMSAGNVSGLQARLRYFLGMTETSHWPYSEAVTSQDLKIVSDEQFRQSVGNVHFVRVNQDNTLFKRSKDVPLRRLDERTYQKQRQGIIDSFKLLRNGDIPQSLFAGGIDIKRYKIAKRHTNRLYQLYFVLESNSKGESTWLALGNSSEIKVLVAWANLLRTYLIELNRRAEDCYVVEHMLLRDKDWQGDAPESPFHAFEVSLVLPAYTARTMDSGFQLQTQYIIRENMPAHLYAHCLWLDFAKMRAFESLYHDWLDARRLSQGHSSSECSEDCYQKAQNLAQWLKANQL